MLSDSASTVAGAMLGTSTVTTYVESAAGVKAGGRTGMTSLVIGVLFLCLFILQSTRYITSKRNRWCCINLYSNSICT